jgi:hypothetical protein
VFLNAAARTSVAFCSGHDSSPLYVLIESVL